LLHNFAYAFVEKSSGRGFGKILFIVYFFSSPVLFCRPVYADIILLKWAIIEKKKKNVCQVPAFYMLLRLWAPKQGSMCAPLIVRDLHFMPIHCREDERKVMPLSPVVPASYSRDNESANDERHNGQVGRTLYRYNTDQLQVILNQFSRLYRYGKERLGIEFVIRLGLIFNVTMVPVPVYVLFLQRYTVMNIRFSRI
jgi:hypothetical protein